MELAADNLRYRAAMAVARAIERLPLNRVTSDVVAGRVIYRKRRRWYASALIMAARLAGGRFRVLSGEAWYSWERAVYQQIYGEEVVVTADGALAVPARPGTVLAVWLAGRIDTSAVLTACEAALQALAELHRREIVLPSGEVRPFSHGDATLANVTYDVGNRQAWWFDFETGFAPHRSPSWRQAEDVHALLCSATALLGAARGVLLAQRIVERYHDSPVLSHLQESIVHVQHFPDPLHLAQTRVSPQELQLLANALLKKQGA
jgi:hypothetical protein